MAIHNMIKSGDWKGEKHVPVITCADTFKAGEAATIELSVGKEIAHPNTLEHYIKWIKLYFVAEGTELPIEVAELNFIAHGEGEVLAQPTGTVTVSLPKSGKLIAVSYCNIHGLWESEKEITVA
ncbi:MAG: Neelaredoxin [Veillonella sp.]|nr:Neelaredoxin [Veillonella sp.]MCF0156781.1 Neelaredoxin [Veillonella sp.]